MPRKTHLAILILVLTATACGGGGDDADGVASLDETSETASDVAPDAADTTADDEEKVLAFAACMREGGIDFPDPVVDSEGNVGFDLIAMSRLADIEQEEIEAAFLPCADHLEGVNFGFDRVFEPEFQDDVVAFAVCMRENGYDMPDPDFSGLTEGEPMFPGWEPDVDDPDFEVAFEACEDQLPGIPGVASS
jgi:hypothetical protein